MNNPPINVHELLKRQVFSEDITPHSRNKANANNSNIGNSNYMFFEQNRPYSDQTFGISDSYLILDSFTKSASSNLENGEISWNIQTQGPTNIDQGIIGSINLLANVIEIELGSFTLPILKESIYPINTNIAAILTNNNISLIQNNNSGNKLIPELQEVQIPPQAPPSLPTSITSTKHTPWYNNPLSQTPFGGQITIQIKEAGVQAYTGGHTSALHHFIFQIQYNDLINSPNSTNVVPMSEGTNLFIFTEPIIDFNSITLVFRNPDYTLQFEPDIINCNIICDFENPINGQYFLHFINKNHNLLTEDRIYLKNFKSGIGALDNYINSSSGILVGYAPDLNGLSQNIATGVSLSDSDIFYTDPFIAFNQNFVKTTTVNKFIIKEKEDDMLEISATIIFSFGQTTIHFRTKKNDIINGDFAINKCIQGKYNFVVATPGEGIQVSGFATINRLEVYHPVFVGKRRIRIPIRLRTAINKVTNYITPI